MPDCFTFLDMKDLMNDIGSLSPRASMLIVEVVAFGCWVLVFVSGFTQFGCEAF